MDPLQNLKVPASFIQQIKRAYVLWYFPAFYRDGLYSVYYIYDYIYMTIVQIPIAIY